MRCARPHLAGVAVEVVLLQRAADEHRRLRVQAHGLVDHACGELELLHVGQRGLAVANHTVHLAAEEAVGVAERV